MRHLFLILFIFNYSFSNDTLKVEKKIKNSLIVAPLINNTLETNWSFGAAGAYVFRTDRKDSSLRASTLGGGLLYTLNNQIIGGLGAYVFFPKSAYLMRLESTFSKFPDKFWGIGNNTNYRQNNPESYTFTQVFINPQFCKKIAKNTYLGLGYNFQAVFSIDTNLSYANKPKLDNSYFGKEKVEGIYNNPDSKYIVSGVEIHFVYDSQNHAYMPNKGTLWRIRFTHYLYALGSDYEFPFLEIDFRKFYRITKKSTLALNSFSLFNFGDKVPFRNLGNLGGRNYMRGYYDGRFRDQKYFSFQGEYRFPIWWRFSGVGFLGFGRVAKNMEDFVFDGKKISLDGFKISFGGGLRVAILPKEKLNIRIDYGFGIVGPGALSIVLAEAF